MEELMSIIDDIQVSIAAAQWSAGNGDISNVLYNIDRAEIEIMRARMLTLSIFHHGEKNG